MLPPGDSATLELAVCQLSVAPALREHFDAEGGRRAVERRDRRTIEATAQGNTIAQKNTGLKGAAHDWVLVGREAFRLGSAWIARLWSAKTTRGAGNI